MGGQGERGWGQGEHKDRGRVGGWTGRAQGIAPTMDDEAVLALLDLPIT